MGTVVDGTEIRLTGAVGDTAYWYDDGEGGFDSESVVHALAQVGRGKDISVIVNSGGGIASEGAAIHSILSSHKGKVKVIVQGVAASAASIIAMAGDEILMSPGAVMMIHDPSGFTFGTVDDHEKTKTALEAIAESMASIYADKSGKKPAEARTDMKTEIWLNPEEAVKQGYATGVVTKAANEPDPEPTAFNYKIYAHAPKRFTALVDSHRWDMRMRATAAIRPQSSRREPAMAFTAEQQAAIDAEVARQREEDKQKGGTGSISQTDAAAIVSAATAAGVPELAAVLMQSGATLAQANARIADARGIKDVVAKTRKLVNIDEGFEAQMIAEGRTLAQVRDALLDHVHAQTEKGQTTSRIVVPTGETSTTTGNGKQPATAAQLSSEAATDNMKKLVAGLAGSK